jgi:hypothetical protein
VSDSLKDKNVKMVAALVGVSVLAAWAVSAGVGGALELRKVLLELGAAAAYTAIVTWLSTLLPADWKHHLVFLRLTHSLPGHRFYELAKRDSRIDIDAVHAIAPVLSADESSPEDQNRLWYNEFYKQVEDHPRVLGSHKLFLAFRDAASAMAIIVALALLGLVWGAITGTPTIAPVVVGVLVVETLALVVAARNAGTRFVVNTVAVSTQGRAASATQLAGER